MIHPDTQVVPISPEIGLGVRTTAAIPRGTVVWAQDPLDQVIDAAAYAALSPAVRALVDRFAHHESASVRILCWDGGRFVNHACAPNLRGLGSRMMLATRDIAAGEELTCDYAECYLEAPLRCVCGRDRPGCRGEVTREDLVTFGAAWDREALELAVAARGVAQPLWPYLIDPDEASDYVDGRRTPPPFASMFRG